MVLWSWCRAERLLDVWTLKCKLSSVAAYGSVTIMKEIRFRFHFWFRFPYEFRFKQMWKTEIIPVSVSIFDHQFHLWVSRQKSLLKEVFSWVSELLRKNCRIFAFHFELSGWNYLKCPTTSIFYVFCYNFLEFFAQVGKYWTFKKQKTDSKLILVSYFSSWFFKFQFSFHHLSFDSISRPKIPPEKISFL